MTFQKYLIFSSFLFGCLVSSNAADKKVVCYMAIWASARPEPGNFQVENADTDHCTHIIYAFMALDREEAKIISVDEYIDLEKDGAGKNQLGKFKLLKEKNPNVKLMVSVGGYNEKGRKFSDVARDPKLRKLFSDNAVEFLKQYGLDGLDICWQFPGDRGGRPNEDKKNAVLLFQEIQNAFKPEGFQLSIHILGKRYIIDQYDIEKVAEIVDFINLVAVEYSGPWDRTTGVMAPLKSKNQNNVEFAVDYTIKLMEGRNRRPELRDKLLLGVPLYGHAYVTAKAPTKNNYTGLFSTETFQGPWTREGGIISFQETCNELKHTTGWEQVWDEESQTPVAFKGRKYITYDNDRSLLLKADLVMTRSLGGVAFWSIDMDDFNGICFNKTFPMVSAVSDYLRKGDRTNSIGGLEKGPSNPALPLSYSEGNDANIAKRSTEVEIPKRITRGVSEGGKTIVCYVASWATTRSGFGRFTVDDIDHEFCTHIIYAFLHVDPTTGAIEIPKYSKSFISEMNSLKIWKETKIQKVLISVGGWSQRSLRFSNMAASADKRAIFINSVLHFIREYNLDGVDICWQFPTQRGGKPEDKENSLTLFKELKNRLSEHGWILTVHILGHQNIVDSYDIKAVSDVVDFINFATLDYHGPWEKFTKPPTPLTSSDNLNIKYNLNYILKKGVPPSKILLGLATFGRLYQLAEEPRGEYIGLRYDHELTWVWSNDPGFIGYNELCYDFLRDNWFHAWDDYSQTPITYRIREIAFYDNQKSLKLKANLVLQKRLAGVMIWSLDTDDFKGLCGDKKYPLLYAISDHVNRRTNYARNSENSTKTEASTPKSNATADDSHVLE